MNLLTTLLMAQDVAVQAGEEMVTEVMTEAAVAEMSLWDMACKGGWIMIVLALLSVVCFYIFFGYYLKYFFLSFIFHQNTTVCFISGNA